MPAKKLQKGVTWTASNGTTISFPKVEYGPSLTISFPQDRKGEQAYIEARNALYRNPAFRKDIQGLRRMFPSAHWKKENIWWPQLCALERKLSTACETTSSDFRKQFPNVPCVIVLPKVEHAIHSEAERICKKWGIATDLDSIRWVVWLVQYWNPANSDKLPPLAAEPKSNRTLFYPWSLAFERRGGPREKSTAPHKATITLRPGVSLRDALKLAKQAVDAFGATSKRKGSRPGFTDLDREALHAAFTQLGLPAKRAQKAMLYNVQQIMQGWGRSISHAAIRTEWRRWLVETGDAQTITPPRLESR